MIDFQKHQGLVHIVCKRFRWAIGSGVDYEDLVSEGNAGLLRAMQTYDETKGAFTTYAVYWIRSQVQRCVHDQSRTVRIPQSSRKKLQEQGILFPQHGLSLDAQVSSADGEDRTFLDLLADGKPLADDDHNTDDAARITEEALSNAKLSSLELAAIIGCVMQGRMLRDVGREVGKSHERVRQCVVSGLQKLRESFGVETAESITVTKARRGGPGARARERARRAAKEATCKTT